MICVASGEANVASLVEPLKNSALERYPVPNVAPLTMAFTPLPEESNAVVPPVSSIFHHASSPFATPTDGFTTTVRLAFVVPPLLNAFVGLLKTATLAAAVGAPEILYRGQNEMNRTGQIVLVVAVIIGLYVLVTMPLTRAVAVLERRVRRYAHA